ncbi:MAG: hypothetical protein OXH51_13290 [Gemmatimonadetes bacterium]|nr:hypothetical protein [Gemmatimonadota bacterium]
MRTVLSPYLRTAALVATATSTAAVATAATTATATAQDRDRPLDAGFEEVYRVGGVAAPDWAQFTRPGTVAFDGSGNLFVLDILAAEIVVIGTGGQLVRTIGGPGEGPGEFRSAGDMVVWRDGRIAVADMGHGAYQLFDPAGELERMVSMGADDNPFAGMTTMRMAIRGAPDGGSLFAQGMPNVLGGFGAAMAEMMGTEIETPDRVDDRGIEQLDLSGEVVAAETVLQAWSPPSEPAPEVSASDLMNVSAMMRTAFGQLTHYEPRLLWDLLPDGTIAYSDSSAYAVRLLAPDGSVRAVLTRPLRPERVTPRIRAATIEQRIEDFQGEAGSVPEEARGLMDLMGGDVMREGIENAPFFDEIPVITRIRATWAGNLWIQRRGEEPWSDSGPIDVFGADGRYVGTFAEGLTEMPNAFGPDGRVAFVELDEFDVPTIVVRTVPAEVR